MNGIVVDTNVVSYLIKGDTRASFFTPHLEGKLLIISFMTKAELLRWTITSHWGPRRKAEMTSYLAQHYVTYASNEALCRTWAEITTRCEKLGRPIGTADAWIAATALVNGMALATYNRSDFEAVPKLKLVCPAKP